MKFEELYQKYIDGTATEEERLYVENEIEKAKKLNAIIDAQEAKRVVAPVEKEEVKKAKKQFRLRSLIALVLIGLAVFMVAGGAICGGVFGTAISNAKRVNHFESTAEAGECAKRFVSQSLKVEGNLVVTEIDRDIRMTPKLKSSYYEYIVEVEDMRDNEYEILIDGRTGGCTLIDID